MTFLFALQSYPAQGIALQMPFTYFSSCVLMCGTVFRTLSGSTPMQEKSAYIKHLIAGCSPPHMQGNFVTKTRKCEAFDRKTVLAAAAKACCTFGGRSAALVCPVQLCTDSCMHAGTLFAQFSPPLHLCTMAVCTNTLAHPLLSGPCALTVCMRA